MTRRRPPGRVHAAGGAARQRPRGDPARRALRHPGRDPAADGRRPRPGRRQQPHPGRRQPDGRRPDRRPRARCRRSPAAARPRPSRPPRPHRPLTPESSSSTPAATGTGTGTSTADTTTGIEGDTTSPDAQAVFAADVPFQAGVIGTDRQFTVFMSRVPESLVNPEAAADPTLILPGDLRRITYYLASDGSGLCRQERPWVTADGVRNSVDPDYTTEAADLIAPEVRDVTFEYLDAATGEYLTEWDGGTVRGGRGDAERPAAGDPGDVRPGVPRPRRRHGPEAGAARLPGPLRGRHLRPADRRRRRRPTRRPRPRGGCDACAFSDGG